MIVKLQARYMQIHASARRALSRLLQTSNTLKQALGYVEHTTGHRAIDRLSHPINYFPNYGELLPVNSRNSDIRQPLQHALALFCKSSPAKTAQDWTGWGEAFEYVPSPIGGETISRNIEINTAPPTDATSNEAFVGTLAGMIASMGV